MTHQLIVDNRGFKERVARWLLRHALYIATIVFLLFIIATAGCVDLVTFPDAAGLAEGG